MFAATQGGHFSELLGLSSLFGRFYSVLLTSNLYATKDRNDLKDFKAIEYSRAMSDITKYDFSKKRPTLGGLTLYLMSKCAMSALESIRDINPM